MVRGLGLRGLGFRGVGFIADRCNVDFRLLAGGVWESSRAESLSSMMFRVLGWGVEIGLGFRV